MTILKREDLRNKLRKREFAPVYLFFGAETYLRDLAARTIADLVLTDSSLREFNETEYNLAENKIEYALGDAEQLPMISSRRVIKITNVKVSSTVSKDNLKEEDEDILKSYLSRPSETSVVIFIADEFDKRRRISKLLLNYCVAVEFSELSDNELLNWAKSKLSEINVEADEKALRHLVGLVGNNVRRLTNELEKLATASLPDAQITYDLVEALVANSREMDNFALTDHLMDKNKKQVLHTLKKILDDGAEPLMILGLIASNFRRLTLAKEMMNQGLDRKEIMRIIKLPPFLHDNFLASARRADSNKLSKIIQRIAETDVAIKSSKGGGGKSGSRLQIEMLVYELVGL
jgi:DNA polymerase-3 subunit delta